MLNERLNHSIWVLYLVTQVHLLSLVHNRSTQDPQVENFKADFHTTIALLMRRNAAHIIPTPLDLPGTSSGVLLQVFYDLGDPRAEILFSFMQGTYGFHQLVACRIL